MPNAFIEQHDYASARQCSPRKASPLTKLVQNPAKAGGAARVATSGVRLGTYWRPDTFEDAKRAYLGDLDSQPDSPGSFAGWINRSIELHSRLTPERRAEIAQGIGDEPRAGRGVSRSFHVEAATVDAMEDAIVKDRKTLGRVTSRTLFVADSVREAVKEARERYGAELPTAPARLPNRPPRG